MDAAADAVTDKADAAVDAAKAKAMEKANHYKAKLAKMLVKPPPPFNPSKEGCVNVKSRVEKDKVRVCARARVVMHARSKSSMRTHAT